MAEFIEVMEQKKRMCREDFIKAIYMGYNCDGCCEDVEMSCRECIEKKFAEYEKQITADAIEECKQILLDAMARDGKTKCHEYMVAINEMEQLKGAEE